MRAYWTLDSEHYCCCVFQKQVYAPGALSWLFLTWIKSCSCLKPGTLRSFPRRSKVSVFIVIFNKVDSKRDFLDFKGESVTQTECGMLSPARTESILAAVWDVPGFRWTLHGLSEQCNRNKSFTRLYLSCKEILGFQLEQVICYLEGWRFNPWLLECPWARCRTSGFSDVLNGVWMLDIRDQHECVSHGWKLSARVEKHHNKNQSVYSKQAVHHFPLYYISKVCATISIHKGYQPTYLKPKYCKNEFCLQLSSKRVHQVISLHASVDWNPETCLSDTKPLKPVFAGCLWWMTHRLWFFWMISVSN